MLGLTLIPGHTVVLKTLDGEIIIRREIGENSRKIFIDAPQSVQIMRDNLTASQRERFEKLRQRKLRQQS